ncbi:hypothetical protein [Sinomonas sp. G460-2]|uniref:hypothetical protein n=1 Tax=Sinomonas sp. G460-2 TaxID=3393464 RepID=UPI0039F07038
MTDVQQSFDRVYPVPPNTLYAAVKAALTQGPYKEAQFDEFTRSVTFRSKGGAIGYLLRWQGQVLEDGGGSRLHLTGGAYASDAYPAFAVRRSNELFTDVSKRCAAMV